MRGKSRELVMAEYSCDSRIQEGGVLHETMELILFMCMSILLTMYVCNRSFSLEGQQRVLEFSGSGVNLVF